MHSNLGSPGNPPALAVTMGKRVAVVLAGCGVYDGSEIHESSAVLVHLSREGAQVRGTLAGSCPISGPFCPALLFSLSLLHKVHVSTGLCNLSDKSQGPHCC